MTGLRFRYTGQQLLGGLGLYYYKARFYSPALGRFLQTDPIGYKDDANLYAYVKNNPVNATDPSGTLAFFWHLGITYTAARDSGMGIVDSGALAWDTMMVDRGTQGTAAVFANQHAMLGMVPNGNGAEHPQTVAEGTTAINSIFATASLPVAVHAAQDAATPLHYMQVWDGGSSLGDLATHLVQDTLQGGLIHQSGGL